MVLHAQAVKFADGTAAEAEDVAGLVLCVTDPVAAKPALALRERERVSGAHEGVQPHPHIACRLEALGSTDAMHLRGKAAVAQGQLAYRMFTEKFQGARWSALAARGARVQRPLWASTSTKNPSYRDTLYVEELIGPHTVNTLPDATLEAFDDHGVVARRVDLDVAAAEHTWQAIGAAGVDHGAVAEQLEREGVSSFQKSFDELLTALTAKAAELG
ncbi:MAG: hypothetical protein EBV02_03735 [Actinobacteria bacterium]|nr:hypothetical protein [Actinomycetota bacterium]